MIRVSEEFKCPVCFHSDWCLVSPDGTVAICPRTPSDKEIGEAGYLHILDDAHKGKRIPYTKIKKKYPINWGPLNELYKSKKFFDNAVLQRMETGWDGEAYTYPMRDAEMEIVGIQRRFSNGDKKVVKGSNLGLFIPVAQSWDDFFEDYKHCLVCEGVSDTITALSLGFQAIGRCSCNTGIDLILELFQNYSSLKIIIIADNDAVGIRGARKLQAALLKENRTSALIIPPDEIKDLSDWVEGGLDREQLMKYIEDVWEYVQC